MFLSASILVSRTVNIDIGRPWWGPIFFLAACIYFINLLTYVFPRSTSTTNALTTPKLTRLRDSPVQWWRIIASETCKLVLVILRMSSVSRWRVFSSQLGCNTSAWLRSGPAPVSIIHTTGCILDESSPTDTEISSFLFLKSDTLSVSGNAGPSLQRYSSLFLAIF